MAKKRREWRAWMIVTKRGTPINWGLYQSKVQAEAFAEKWLGERIIRVRIVEDGR